MSVVEGIGVISQVLACEGVLTPSGEPGEFPQGFPASITFNLGVKIAGNYLECGETGLMDLTDGLNANETVAFSATDAGGSGESGWHVTNLTPLRDAQSTDTSSPNVMIEFGTIQWIEERDGGGKISTEKWGDIHFDDRAVAHPSESARLSDPQGNLRRGRTVVIKVEADNPQKILSICPLGKVYNCEGAVIKMGPNSGVIGSYAFGRIHFTFQTLKPPVELGAEKRKLFDNLLSLKVKVKIVDSIPSQGCRWKAVAVFLPHQNLQNVRTRAVTSRNTSSLPIQSI